LRASGAIEPKLRSAEIKRARRKPTESLDAYDLFLRAVALNTSRKKEDNEDALRLLYRAIEIDPRYAAAYALACEIVASGYAQEMTGERKLPRLHVYAGNRLITRMTATALPAFVACSLVPLPQL
jgi:hypothetical protein